MLRDTVTPANTGRYKYLPFEVPTGIKRVAVKLALTPEGGANVGVGLFDWRGTEYQSPGFRGVYGEENHEFFVGPEKASVALIPGNVRRSRWTVIVPVFRAESPSEIEVTVTFSFGREDNEPSLGWEVGVLKGSPGWYKGDLHCHTVHSSDARASGTVLTPSGWAEKAKEIGLDWISLTDHNVTTQNRHLRKAAGNTGVLLLGGEEMTNWFHGHATVTGLPTAPASPTAAAGPTSRTPSSLGVPSPRERELHRRARGLPRQQPQRRRLLQPGPVQRPEQRGSAPRPDPGRLRPYSGLQRS